MGKISESPWHVLSTLRDKVVGLRPEAQRCDCDGHAGQHHESRSPHVVQTGQNYIEHIGLHQLPPLSTMIWNAWIGLETTWDWRLLPRPNVSGERLLAVRLLNPSTSVQSWCDDGEESAVNRDMSSFCSGKTPTILPYSSRSMLCPMRFSRWLRLPLLCPPGSWRWFVHCAFSRTFPHHDI